MKTLVLTGASRGIGHATVKRFSAAGWRIITCSRQAFSEKCPWAAGPEDHIQVDLGDTDQVAEAIDQIKQRLDGAPLQALVNNAAISPKNAQGERLDTVNTDIQLWHSVFQVNFFAPLLLVRGLLAELTEAQGVVINVTSIAGGRVHEFAGSAYATSKAALAATWPTSATARSRKCRPRTRPLRPWSSRARHQTVAVCIVPPCGSRTSTPT